MFKGITLSTLFLLVAVSNVSSAGVTDETSKKHCSEYATEFVERQGADVAAKFKTEYGYEFYKFAFDGCNELENEEKFKIITSGADSALIEFCSNVEASSKVGTYSKVYSCVEEQLANKL